MNYRKDIYEKVKFMLKDNTQVDINCSKLARQYGCDRRTVSKAINAVKNNLPPPKTNKPRKTDAFELIIEEKLKTGAPAIAIFNYIIKHHANIRKCMQCAVVEGLIPTKYADRVELPKIEQYNASFFDSEQIKVVLEKGKGTEIEHIIILCVYYGLRRSEVLGLKWNAVNFNDNTIRIYNTVTYMYTMCEKERTKKHK